MCFRYIFYFLLLGRDVPVFLGCYGRSTPPHAHAAGYRSENGVPPKVFNDEPSGRRRWAFPTTWLMGQRAGYWKSIAAPRMEGGSSKSLRKAVRREPAKPLRGAR